MSSDEQQRFTPSEMMIVAAARALAGARTVFVGVGLPNIACNLARYTVAPNLELIYEAGVYGARPARLPLSTFFSLWFDRAVPMLGRLAGDRDAYTYLPESVRSFPPPPRLAELMDGAGFERIRWTILAGGIIALHSGEKTG